VHHRPVAGTEGRDGGAGREPRRHHRPVPFDPAQAAALPGDADPQLRGEIAHTTAAALVHRARASQDPDVVQRLVALVETEGLDMVAAMWADSPADTLPGALWRLYVLREWVRRDPATVADRYRMGVASAPVHDVVAGVVSPPGSADVRAVADAVLSGVYAGDLAVALERAAAFCQVLATGAASPCRPSPGRGPDRARGRCTRRSRAVRLGAARAPAGRLSRPTPRSSPCACA
jgi:hypothetical protein